MEEGSISLRISKESFLPLDLKSMVIDGNWEWGEINFCGEQLEFSRNRDRDSEGEGRGERSEVEEKFEKVYEFEFPLQFLGPLVSEKKYCTHRFSHSINLELS